MPATDHRQLQAAVQESREHSVLFVQLPALQLQAQNEIEIKKESNQNFWFISKNKEEPRLADRYLDKGSELEQPLAIARDICKLYERISNQK